MRHLCETELALFGCVGQTAHEQGLLGKCGAKIMIVPKEAVHIAAAHTKIMPPNTLIQTVLSRYTMYDVLGIGVA